MFDICFVTCQGGLDVSGIGKNMAPEDYMERCCGGSLFSWKDQPAVEQIPQQRIIEKIDELSRKRDYGGVRNLLLYWLKEAEHGNDKKGELFILNELIGCYRKAGQKDNAFDAVRKALDLMETLPVEGTLLEGTTYVNAATACNAFGEDEKALALFEKARKVYESNESVSPDLLGGLYNNMGLACQKTGRFSEAAGLYEKALANMEKVPGGTLEQAITCLNMADTAAGEHGLLAAEARIGELLERAYALLRDENVTRNGYYAFVCEKCAPGFSYYGYFAAAAELKKEAEKIYERNGAL